MNYRNLKSAINVKVKSIEVLAKEMGRHPGGLRNTLNSETLTLKDFESICKIINEDPCSFFNDQVANAEEPQNSYGHTVHDKYIALLERHNALHEQVHEMRRTLYDLRRQLLKR